MGFAHFWDVKLETQVDLVGGYYGAAMHVINKTLFLFSFHGVLLSLVG